GVTTTATNHFLKKMKADSHPSFGCVVVGCVTTTICEICGVWISGHCHSPPHLHHTPPPPPPLTTTCNLHHYHVASISAN
nr:hypothetical protein [Tanacetum cinerariifolium]